MMENMQDLAFEDLQAADERLYVAALRFVRAFERDELDQLHADDGSGPSCIHIGPAQRLLCEAAKVAGDAYDRCEASGAFLDPRDEAEPA